MGAHQPLRGAAAWPVPARPARGRVAIRRLLPLPLLALAAARADEAPTARDILRKAVEAQGKLGPDGIRDVTLTFEGQAQENGQDNAITRTYRFRASDRSFRVHTGAEAVDRSTDRGVFGTDGYWQKTSKGRFLALSKGNRDDRETIKQIETERSDFERMLRMVLLVRIDDGWTVTLGAPEPQRLATDCPHELNRTLGDREAVTYHVLDLRRAGEAPLRLYVNTEDHTVRKAIEYEAEAPDRVRFVYYFAAYAPDKELGIVLPRYFSVYRDTPLDKDARDKLNAVRGMPKVEINTRIGDGDLRPAP
ncbi:MAG TPA: hypothetical protein VFY93_02495 [Planctomycetota bacterium]|nr:hypothetical protein [Planctomycetota bacterium]